MKEIKQYSQVALYFRHNYLPANLYITYIINALTNCIVQYGKYYMAIITKKVEMSYVNQSIKRKCFLKH